MALEAAGGAWHLTEGEADALAIASCLESGAGGKLFFHIMGAVAEFEQGLTIERTKASLAAARKRGPDRLPSERVVSR